MSNINPKRSDNTIKAMLGNCLSQIKKEISSIKKGTWIIIDSKYFQFSHVSNDIVFLLRYGNQFGFNVFEYTLNSRLALPSEIDQHIEFMLKNNKPYYKEQVTTQTNSNFEKCEFYMITCRGVKGTTVRHNTYEQAEKEAIRIAGLEKHETWILGVVAKVKPQVTVSHVVTKNFE